MTPRVVGLDLSLTATGIAFAHGGTHTLKVKDKTGPDRLRCIRGYVMHAVNDLHRYGSDLVVLEGYAYAKGQGAHQIGELGGVIRLALHEGGFRWVEVAPAALKKYATGNGGANKDLVRDAARDRLGLPAGVSSDECDAAWLRAMGLDALGHPIVAMPAVNRAALERVDWPEVVS